MKIKRLPKPPRRALLERNPGDPRRRRRFENKCDNFLAALPGLIDSLDAAAEASGPDSKKNP